MKPTIENMKSCANCKAGNSSLTKWQHKETCISGFTFARKDIYCDNCKNYSRWKQDNLTKEERFEQEKGK